MKRFRLWWDQSDGRINAPDYIEAERWAYEPYLPDNPTWESSALNFYKGDAVVASFARFPMGITEDETFSA